MKEFNWHIINDFRHVKMSGPLTALYFTEVVQEVSGGLTSAFFAAFLYWQLHYSLISVSLYFLVSYFLWLFMIPWGAKLMQHLGLKKSMLISIFFGTAYFYFLSQFADHQQLWYLAVAIITVNINRLFFWVQYHTDFAKFSDPKTRGKQISLFTSVASLVAVALPILSGHILDKYDFSALFLLAGLVYTLSLIPLLFIPERYTEYSYGYWETYKKLFTKENWRMSLSYIADGAQMIVGMAYWPLFIWLLLDKSYVAVGAVTSLIIFVSMIVRFTAGDLTDKYDKRKVMRVGTILYAIGWIFKIFVATGFQIFIASTYHNFANIVMRTSFDALTYERASNAGSQVDEYCVLREISLCLGRLLMTLLVMGIFWVTKDMTLAFIAAAVASLLVNLI